MITLEQLIDARDTGKLLIKYHNVMRVLAVDIDTNNVVLVRTMSGYGGSFDIVGISVQDALRGYDVVSEAGLSFESAYHHAMESGNPIYCEYIKSPVRVDDSGNITSLGEPLSHHSIVLIMNDRFFLNDIRGSTSITIERVRND